MIRFLDAAALPQPIYAVEVDGRLYAPEEIAAIVGAALAYRAAVLACNGIVAAEQALFGAIGQHSTDEGAKVCARSAQPWDREKKLDDKAGKDER